MKNQNSSIFAVKPVVTAVGLAMSAAAAFAAPTPNQLPGAGQVVTVSPGATVNAGGVGTNIVNLANPATITLGGAATSLAVINWGGVAGAIAAEITNPIGFNIGSAGKLTFTSAGGTTFASVLNIDASGNSSQIFGQLEASAVGGGIAPSIFVANGNGIVVGASGRIAAPNGVGLIGANLNNATAKFDFVGNNSVSTSFVDVTTGQSTVTVSGSINGSLTANVPAQYILLAGGDIVNTSSGNQFSVLQFNVAGLRTVATTDTVNAVAGTTVNRLFYQSAPGSITPAFNANLGTAAGNFEIASAGSTFVNTGSLSSPGLIYTFAANGIRSGTAGDTNPLVGMFADFAIVTATYTAGAKTELYNVISGYSTNKSLGQLVVNGIFTGSTGDVTINALTPGSQPSSVSTLGNVLIAGENVAINSTINHASNVGETTLQIASTKSLSVTAAIGAGGSVALSNTGTGGVTISGNVVGDTNKSGSGGITISNTGKNAPTTISGNLTTYGDDINVTVNGPLTISGNINAVNDDVRIENDGTASGNTTTITGNVTGYNYVQVYNYGPLSSNLNVSGTLTAGFEVDVVSGGNLQLGKVDAGYRAYIAVDGLSSMLNGPVTAGNYLYYYGSSTITKAKPAAVLTSPYVYIEALTFQGVNASGANYVNAAEKPSAQIVTNSLDLYLYGSFNAPIAGNTNWLTNQVQVAALDPLSPVDVSISAIGAGFQAINIGITGNATINSGDTYTPFNAVGLTTGTTTAGGLIGNGGSQLIVNASGNLDIWDGYISNFFEFPGGIAFKAGGVLTQYVPVYNAWTLSAMPYQGVFFEAPVINALSYIATNGNSWVNWSVKPVAGAPTIYQITQPAPTTFGFVANPSAAHLNTYSLLITGTPVNVCSGFPPVC